MDDTLRKLMNTRFQGFLWACHFVPKHVQNSLQDRRFSQHEPVIVIAHGGWQVPSGNADMVSASEFQQWEHLLRIGE